jgi:hypothetical protein
MKHQMYHCIPPIIIEVAWCLQHWMNLRISNETSKMVCVVMMKNDAQIYFIAGHDCVSIVAFTF